MPRIAFVGQFYGCMREVDRACGGYFTAMPRMIKNEKFEAAADEAAADEEEAEPAGWADMSSDEEEEVQKVDAFLDIGCAPGGFAQFLLDHSTRWKGVGLTLKEGGHLMCGHFMKGAAVGGHCGGGHACFRWPHCCHLYSALRRA
eukprot:SAG22_NODE_116_length_19306_cov_247.696517_25_plen_145_part_00